MAFEHAGPATSVLGTLATSIGFGLVVGGFIGGTISFISTRSEKAAEKWTLIGGYCGAFVSLTLLAIDIFMRSFV
jgi:uncharacterized membrane protein YdcZ (DUF606 family)